MEAVRLAERLGLRVSHETSTDLFCKCPFHKGGNETKASFSISKTKPVWNCYVCGGGPLFILVAKIAGLAPAAAVELLNEHGFTATLEAPELPTKAYGDRFKEDIKVLPEPSLAVFKAVPNGVALQLGFPTALLRECGVLYDYAEDRVIFPVRDSHRRLRAVIGRAIAQ